MKYVIARKQKVMSFEYDHWKYNVLDEIPPFRNKSHADAFVAAKNRDEKRVVGDRFNWYYAVVEKEES